MFTLLDEEGTACYSRDSSSVYCTLISASKAFDRVNYCELFLFHIERNAPPIIIIFFAYVWWRTN